MKCVLPLLVTITMTSGAIYIKFEPIPRSIVKDVYDYHRRIGIPLAERIKKKEHEIRHMTPRITEGSITKIRNIPYQVGLITSIPWKDTESVCGGSLISRGHVLTAAHCYADGFVTGAHMTVVLGSSILFSGGTRFITTDVIIHEDYDAIAVENDIAIVRIPEIEYTSLIQPVALPWDIEDIDFLDYDAIASGFGKTSDDEEINHSQALSVVTVPVISNEQCMESYEGIIQEQHLCTGGEEGKGTCGGDSGGPLVVIFDSIPVLIGITSFGTSSCGMSTPSVFARVTEFLPWISREMQSD